MATKKKPAAAPAAKAAPATPRPAPLSALAPPSGGDPQRLLREAAWSRMFGRTESKNPFARSR